MMRDDTLYGGPWYYNHERHTLVNEKEEAIEASKNAVAEFEKPPKSTTECLLLKLLPLGKFPELQRSSKSKKAQKFTRKSTVSCLYVQQASCPPSSGTRT
jgi:hypothetical protein